MAEWIWPNSTVTNVVDGDTFDATVTRDLGFGGKASFPIRLRLNRINAPKASSDAGKTATAATRGFLLGQPVTIQTYRTYKYGGGDKPEWMAEVTLPDGRNLSDELVFGGWAVYWSGVGPRPADELKRPV